MTSLSAHAPAADQVLAGTITFTGPEIAYLLTLFIAYALVVTAPGWVVLMLTTGRRARRRTGRGRLAGAGGGLLGLGLAGVGFWLGNALGNAVIDGLGGVAGVVLGWVLCWSAAWMLRRREAGQPHSAAQRGA